MTTPRRIVHVVPSLFGDDVGTLGGAERFALELARNMSRHRAVRLVTFGDTSRAMTRDNLEIAIVGDCRWLPGDNPQPFSFALFDHFADAQVIHCHQRWHAATTMSAAFAQRAGVPVYVTDLGGGPPAGRSQPDTSDWFDGYLHITDFARRIAGVEGAACNVVIGCGVDSSWFTPSNEPCHRDRILFVGRILPHKGIDTLIAAITSRMSLTIVGAPMDKRYLRLLRDLATDRSVNFIFNASEEQLLREYQAASVVVLPSVYRTVYGETSEAPELLGQTLLEGMASGRPVICTEVGGMPEVVDDGVTGFVVPPGNAAALRERLETLLNDPDLLAAMGERARQRVIERFSWADVVARCVSVYDGMPRRPR